MSDKKPKNPVTEKGSYRVVRGGRWFDNPHTLRSSFRYGNSPSNHNHYYGFRIARTKK